jgi:hypothetical protein
LFVADSLALRDLSHTLRERLFQFLGVLLKRIIASALGCAEGFQRLENDADLAVKKIDRMLEMLIDRMRELGAF